MAPLKLVAFGIALCVISTTVHGQTGVGSPPASTVSPKCNSGNPGTLTVSGNGVAMATADQAQVAVSIAILNATADGARMIAARYANDVINAVKQIPGIYPDNVTTTSVSVSPQTDYNSETGTSTTIGYTYTNSLSVAIGSLTGDLLSNVLDTAVQNGGNNLTIDSVSFSLSPALSYNKTVEARSQASTDAKTTAQQYAQNFGVNLGPLLSVNDQSSGVTPVQQQESSTTTAGLALNRISSSSSEPTPVSIGKQEVDVLLEVVYTICTPLS